MNYSIAVLIAQLILLDAASNAVADEPLQDWKYSGTLAILTTPDGADMPESASVEEFPLLVRLNKHTFDFSQARSHGEDVRFSANDKPLAFQIDMWDAEPGVAAIWVRIPVINGNRRQLITMHWGKADAESQSNGKAVFNASNGYVVAMHFGDSNQHVMDEVGTVSPMDTGTTSSPGVIGFARHFEAGNGIACGEKLREMPTGANANTTQAWIQAEQVNTTVVGWGNEQAQGKVVMQIRSPPQVRMDCYFSNADVASTDQLPMREWVHLAHTYSPGESRLYVNGLLAGQTSGNDSPLKIRKPARMWLGGWQDALIRDFYVDDEAEKVISGSVKENVLLLKLNESGKATRLTYLKERDWNQDRLLLGTNGLAALTFCDVAILQSDD